jgi:hypothetical protein
LLIRIITGLKESFSSKELADYLSVEGLNALTKAGRVAKRKDYTLMQMKAIEKVINKFFDDISTIKDVKSYTQKVSKMLGQKVSIKQADVFYRVTHDYKWIYDYFTESEFWKDFAPLARTQDVETWQKTLETYAHGDIIKEPNLRYKVISLYHYVRGD